jgi:hypothetical protein
MDVIVREARRQGRGLGIDPTPRHIGRLAGDRVLNLTQGGSSMDLDKLTKDLTAFPSFQAMLDAPNYRPTILIQDQRYLLLALGYDAAQKARGDERRAFTGHTMPQAGDPIRFYALGARRVGRIEKVGTKRVLVSYATKAAIRVAKRFGSDEARRSRRYLNLETLTTFTTSESGRGWRQE